MVRPLAVGLSPSLVVAGAQHTGCENRIPTVNSFTSEINGQCFLLLSRKKLDSIFGLRCGSTISPRSIKAPRPKAMLGFMNLWKPKSEAQLAKADLLDAISRSDRGLNKDPNLRDEILQSIDALTALGEGTVTTDESLTANWKLLWTTEKETLFILERAGLFGTSAGDTLQPISVQDRTLGNIITFPPAGAFEVKASIEIVSAQRVNFKFLGASLRTPRGKFPLPPFGQGWFENVYMDDKIRISRDSRGDTLVTERAPYNWPSEES